jgi:thymidylate synthase
MTALVDGLISDPFSRRHLITTFDPSVTDACALMPCHGIAIQFYVGNGSGAGGRLSLSCHVYCRSSDIFLGLGFNIASYAVLTYIIAKKVDMDPDELIVSTGDTHIYSNHVDQVREQLDRHPLPFPKLTVSDEVRDLDWSELTIDHFDVAGYISHPAIKAPMAV